MKTQKVSKWGNSLGISLPDEIAVEMGLAEGTLLSIYTDGNRIILSPENPKYSLDELLQNVTPEMQHNECDWGEA
jgi:antitoxin MazE